MLLPPCRQRPVLFLLLLILAVTPRAGFAVTTPTKPTRIVCLGDSVTKGARSGVEPSDTFCAVLQKMLDSSQRPIEVINSGIGGHTTKDALARFERDVLAHEPATVVIMFGLNDSWIDAGKSASRLTVDQYRGNLQAMLSELKRRDIKVVLMTPNPALAPMYPAERNLTLKPYVDVVRELARSEHLELIDLYARFAELALEGVDPNTLFTDAMHPNPAGHRLIAELLAPRLRPLLPVPKP